MWQFLPAMKFANATWNPNTELVGIAFYEIPDSLGAQKIAKTVNFNEVINSRNISFSGLDTVLQIAPVLLDPTSNQLPIFSKQTLIPIIWF